MMWDEFEQIAGYQVSYSDYVNVIEPMYNATTLSKAEFVKTINRSVFDLKIKRYNMIKEMRAIAQERKENAEHYTNYSAEDRLVTLAAEYVETFHFGCSPDLIREYCWGDRGCTYPATLAIWAKRYRTGEIYEVERIKLA